MWSATARWSRSASTRTRREERAIRRCNAGPIAFRGARALALLDAVGADNAAREYYLTDLVEIAARSGLAARGVLADEEEAMGVNDRVQLAARRSGDAGRACGAARCSAGATLIAPETVFLSMDTKIGRDVLIEPNVVFGPGVTIDDGAVIHAFSHLEGAHVAAAPRSAPTRGCGPARTSRAKAKIGNFVEIKSASIEAGAKVNHLSYIGDARVGAGANIGAGTITCNYDGFSKFKTDIGAGAFIGSNSALVAPVSDRRRRLCRLGLGGYRRRRGRRARRGARPADVKPGWAKAFRAKKAKT